MAEIPSREAIESCIYCGQEANTRDHVPPKCLFPKPRPPMITVPACLACNKSYEKDDVLLAIATWGEAYIEHPQAMRVWQESLGPLLRRSPRFSAMLASNIMPGTSRTPTGLYLPHRMEIQVSKSRISRAVERIVKGLLWNHYKRIADAETEFDVHRNPPVDSELAEIINTFTDSSWIGGDTFCYRHALANDAHDSSIWAMRFYAYSQYIVIVKGKSFKEATQNETENVLT